MQNLQSCCIIKIDMPLILLVIYNLKYYLWFCFQLIKYKISNGRFSALRFLNKACRRVLRSRRRSSTEILTEFFKKWFLHCHSKLTEKFFKLLSYYYYIILLIINIILLLYY